MTLSSRWVARSPAENAPAPKGDTAASTNAEVSDARVDDGAKLLLPAAAGSMEKRVARDRLGDGTGSLSDASETAGVRHN
jgi:hypothetical protein